MSCVIILFQKFSVEGQISKQKMDVIKGFMNFFHFEEVLIKFSGWINSMQMNAST
jgi:hypothetical protein